MHQLLSHSLYRFDGRRILGWGLHVAPLLAITLLALMLGACAFNSKATGDICTPVDPLKRELPQKPCFYVLQTAENEIRLYWRVVNSAPDVYILNDLGMERDIGLQPAQCASGPVGGCAYTLRVPAGRKYRWQLKVDSPGGRSIYAPAAITIQSPLVPVAAGGGGFVDILAPTDRHITWEADERNAGFDQSTESAWVEVKPPGSLLWPDGRRLPRSGLQARFDISASKLSKAGDAIYSIRDCKIPHYGDTKFCSDRLPIGFFTGSDWFLGPNPIYTEPGKDLEILFTSVSGDERRLYSSTMVPKEVGRDYAATTAPSYLIDASLVTTGIHTIELASCLTDTQEICSTRSRVDVIVGAPIDWELQRDYLMDFEVGVAYAPLSNGSPLDITYDGYSGIWLISEFANSIEHVSPQGRSEVYPVPLARRVDPGTTTLRQIKPFTAAFPQIESVSVGFSTLGERATWDGHRVWFTQGGGMVGDTGLKTHNHSRIISFDPKLEDMPTTAYDDRVCVYNLPADDEHSYGNNQVIGLTGARGRIWVGESRGLFGEESSMISSFVASPEACGNLLELDLPDQLAQQKLRYCESGYTPERNGCMEKLPIDQQSDSLKVAHLATDRTDDTIWFTDLRGSYLGHLDPSGEPKIALYPLPDNRHPERIPGFGGFPWSIRVDDEAVYFAEFSSNHLVRFDKATASFSEIYVPVNSPQVTLHSIDIDEKKRRLWFSLGNETDVPLNRKASTIGYIDLRSWREHVAAPKDRISAVIYQGLDAIPPSKKNPTQHHSFRGIAVDPRSGNIAIASARRDQIIELQVRPGF